MKYMKEIKRSMVICASFLFIVSCDQDFEEINTNPFAVTEIDPALLFAGAQRTHVTNWETEPTIVQQFVNPFNSGATVGPNLNEDNDNMNNVKWNNTYNGPLKNMIQALHVIGDNPNLGNLKSMIRIWKVQTVMGLVDEYADVPYSQAGQAYINAIFFPKYDNDADIYADLELELRESIAALDPAGDYVSADLFYGKNARIPITTATAQVAQWKKLGNSLLLRLGMRYSKLNPAKAATLAAEAFAGGVMASNDDNAMVRYDGTLFTNGANNGLVNNNPYFYYAAEPFVNQLKSTIDPRGRFIIARFAEPGNPLADPNPNIDVTQQFGVPVGVISTALLNAPYRGAKGQGYDYSQINVKCVASLGAPTFWVTYSQTSLLLAEAKQMGWISGGLTVKEYYENGVTADIDTYALYPNGSVISATDKQTYLDHAAVDIDLAVGNAAILSLINTQYWIANIANGTESFANFRRSGYPALSPNLYNNNLNGGFIRRLSYPDYEVSNNNQNYFNAVSAIGADNLVTRVFWDIP
jgi:hypothetical protein